MNFSAWALSLLHLPFATICKWVFEYFMPPALTRRFVWARSTPSGQRASAKVRTSPTFCICILFFDFVFSFSYYFSCFWAQRNSNLPHATCHTWRKLDRTSVLPALFSGRVSKYPLFNHPTGTLTYIYPNCAIYNGLNSTPHIINTLNTHISVSFKTCKEGLINTRTHSHLFICEWTNTHQKCVWNFKNSNVVKSLFFTAQQFRGGNLTTSVSYLYNNKCVVL